MHVHRIEFSFRGKEPPEELADLVMLYLGSLRMNGHLPKRHRGASGSLVHQ